MHKIAIPFHPVEKQIARVGRHQWSVPRLIQLAKKLPIMEVNVLHICTWHKYTDISLREFVGHIQAVLDADLNCPIILDEDGEILDGRHRLMKALLENKKTVKVVRFIKNPEPCKIDTD